MSCIFRTKKSKVSQILQVLHQDLEKDDLKTVGKRTRKTEPENRTGKQTQKKEGLSLFGVGEGLFAVMPVG